MTDAEIQNELNKCVRCCLDMTNWADKLNVCDGCFDNVRMQLPIPPQCLGLEVDKRSPLWYISTKPRGLEELPFHQRNNWKAHAKWAGV